MSVKKRKYSRNGCIECKKRKVKCDERTPICGNCERSEKHCVYKSNSGVRFAVDGSKTSDYHKQNNSKRLKVRFFDPLEKFRYNTSEDIAPSVRSATKSPDTQLELSDLDQLFQEAGDLVNEINRMMGSQEMDMRGQDNTSLDRSLDTEKGEISTIIRDCVEMNGLLQTEEEHLADLTTTNLSYHLYPFASSVKSNEVVRLLLLNLRQCQHMLFSILAISATFQYIQTADERNESSRNEYLSICFCRLFDAFSENNTHEDNTTRCLHIERLLLTVLILTTCFNAMPTKLSSPVATSWGVHLRGARDLLIHYDQMTKLSKVSMELALAKTWFFAFEAVATLFSLAGGSTKNIVGDSIFEESGLFTNNPVYHESLQRLGFVAISSTLSDVNLFLGYTSHGVKTIILMKKTLQQLEANSQEAAQSRQVVDIMFCLAEMTRERIVEGVEDDYKIPLSSKDHPEQEDINKSYLLPLSCFAVGQDDQGYSTTYSWIDACNQLHADALQLMVYVLTKFFGLPWNHHLVQSIKDKILTTAFFIRRKNGPVAEPVVAESEHFYLPASCFDNRCVMVQSAFRLCASIIEQEEEFEMTRLFFTGLVKLGNGSSIDAVEQVDRIMWNRRNGQAGVEWLSVPFA